MNKAKHWVLACFLLPLVLSACVVGGVRSSLDDIRVKANQGDPSAQLQLAVAYDQGRGVAKDPVEAAAWCKKAAEQNYAPAQNCIGSMYQFGQGVTKDYGESVRWYRKAADQGHGEALTNLGAMYDQGLGVKEDKAEAAKLYREGAEKGSVNGMNNLGVSYWRGEGVPKDLVQAYMWLDLARFRTQTSSNMQLKWRVRRTLDQVKKEMTKTQIAAAEKMGREWDAAHRPR